MRAREAYCWPLTNGRSNDSCQAWLSGIVSWRPDLGFMQTWDAITSRRNVRSFAGQPIAAADLDQILEAAPIAVLT